jgi:polyhydroxybutyrate depolymerase
MRPLLLAAALGAAVLAGSVPARAGAEDRQGSLLWEGRPRTWTLHVPPGDAATPRPLVIALHGAGGTGDAFAEETKLGAEADARGFLVAFPDGTGADPARLTWNAGFCCGYAVLNRIDDVGFLLRLIESVGRDRPVDLRRVYLAGMSNGAMLAYRAAAENSERYAAIATVAGAIGGTNRRGEFFQIPTPRYPVPLVIVHGRRDPYVLFDGGVSPVLGYPLRRNLAVIDALRFWADVDGCPGEPTPSATGRDNLVHTGWTNCAGGGEISLWEITDAEHWWPGETPFPRAAAGKSGSFAGLLFSFFARHARPD